MNVLRRMATGWDAAAAGYEAYFVPRFAPWVSVAVDALPGDGLPGGPIVVPCCGTFPELDGLIGHFPGREIVGIDLSAGMIGLARERAAGRPEVRVIEGDAAALDPEWAGRCAGVVSAFGLQQLPVPEAAIRSWAGALRPGGRLSVIFWPDANDEGGPFALMKEVVRARLPAGDGSWEDRLVAAVTAGGATVERDKPVSYPMSHESARDVLAAYVNSGHMRARAAEHGDAFIEEISEEFLRRAPAGEWTHRLRARLIVARA